MGDSTAHGGAIVMGCPTVLIGEVSPGAPSPGMAGAAVAGATNPSFPASAAVAGAVAARMRRRRPRWAGSSAGAAATKPPAQFREAGLVPGEGDVRRRHRGGEREVQAHAAGWIRNARRRHRCRGMAPRRLGAARASATITLPDLDKDSWGPK